MGYNPSLSSRAIIGRFYNLLSEFMGGDWATRLAMQFPSDQASETYNWLGMVPAMREWGTGRLVKQLRTQGLTISNVLYESTLGIDVDDVRRDKTGQIKVRVAEQARRARAHWRKLISTLINNGQGSTSGLCYDGQYFFDTDHAEGASGAQKNVLTASEVSTLNVGTATAPTAAEMAKAILGVIGYMLRFKDDQGEAMNGDAQKFMVMVAHPQIYAPARAACTDVQLEAGSGAVLPNVLRQSGFSVDCVMNPDLLDTDYTDDFFVFRLDGDTRPFIMQVEQDYKVDAIAEGSETEIRERRHEYGITMIGGVGYGMWQHAAFATLS